MTVVDAVEDERRVAAIAAYGALRMPPPELDAVAELAARLTGSPMATVNIITDTEQHQVATYGFAGGVCAREDSMCNLVLDEGHAVMVSDASQDPRLAGNPFVTGELGHVRFYSSYPVRNQGGVTIGTLCVFDESVREVDEQTMSGLAMLAARVIDVYELRLRSRELALSMMEIQAVQAELERSNERLASFAGQVSHDLKTPLTTLSLSLGLIRGQLEDGDMGTDAVGLLDRAVKSSSRMADLIDDVLDYARLGGTLKATEVDLDFVMGDVLDDLGSDLDGVELHIGRLPTVLGDRAQLRAVLQNLVSNAAKYTHPDRSPVVTVTAKHVQRAWRIEVADNGLGIARDDHVRIFEPLTRLDEGSAIEGSGIGLATCRRIIGAHGGRIGSDPSAREGSRFFFELPD